MRAALPLSVAGHVAILALLLLLPATRRSPPKIDLSHAVEVVFAPPAAPPTPPVPPEPPKPVAVPPPPPPEPAVPPKPAAAVPAPAEPPAPPAPTAERRPAPQKREPVPKPRPRPRPEPVEPPAPPIAQWPLPLRPPTPAAPSPAPVRQVPPQIASVPSPPPAPTVSSEYRAVLSGWLESHKRYPEEARQRGEQGRAVLRFRIDRYGRVLDYAIVSSTGFADLDKAVENMMRGATLPPFPRSMTQPEIEVSVAIRFGLAR